MITVVGPQDVIYAPQFVAADLGYFARHQVDVRFRDSPPGYGILSDGGVRRGDLAIGSLWFCYAEPTSLDPLLPIALSNRACHQVLLGRRPARAGETLPTRLAGSVVLIPSDAPTPYAVFQIFLARVELGEHAVRIVTGLTVPGSLALFDAGLGDLLLAPAQEAAATGWPVVCAMTELTGPLPWSVYVARRSTIEQSAAELAGFVTALGEAQQWIAGHGNEELAQALAPRFPGTAGLRGRLDLLLALDIWSTTPELDLERAGAWEAMLRDRGLVRPDAPPVDRLAADAAQALGRGQPVGPDRPRRKGAPPP